MEPASRIIKALGGPSEVARIVGRHRTRVSMWQAPREKGGTGGFIPYECIPKLLDAARDRGLSIGPADFIKIEEEVRP